MRYPSELLTEDEEILRQFRPHWKVLIPALGWAMVLAALVGIAFAAFDIRVVGYATAGAVLVWLLLSSKAVIAWLWTNYVLTTERIIVRSGMIARTGTEIPLENIVNVLYSQRVVERLLGYGDVLVESAGAAGQSRLMDIPDPEGFQSEIYRARELRSLHFKGGGAQARDVIEQLESLADLRERGHLTDAEFGARKAILLGDLPGVERDDIVQLADEGELDLET